jgi:hypothetical protein
MAGCWRGKRRWSVGGMFVGWWGGGEVVECGWNVGAVGVVVLRWWSVGGPGTLAVIVLWVG